MSLFHLVVVALIQGVTEFLPVSSSGHLVLIPQFTSWNDQGQAIDVAAHVGTLIAVLLYFRKESGMLASGAGHIARGNCRTDEARLFLMLGLATIPVVVAGCLLKMTEMTDALRSVAVIGWSMLGFGILLYVADRLGSRLTDPGEWGPRHAVTMGLAQALALIPGTSRSGITITAARALGYDRREAARLAMLMSIPTISAAGILMGVETIPKLGVEHLFDIGLVIVLSFGAALAALHLMMHALSRFSFTPYVVYRIGLGGLLLWVAYC